MCFSVKMYVAMCTDNIVCFAYVDCRVRMGQSNNRNCLIVCLIEGRVVCVCVCVCVCGVCVCVCVCVRSVYVCSVYYSMFNFYPSIPIVWN